MPLKVSEEPIGEFGGYRWSHASPCPDAFSDRLRRRLDKAASEISGDVIAQCIIIQGIHKHGTRLGEGSASSWTPNVMTTAAGDAGPRVGLAVHRNGECFEFDPIMRIPQPQMPSTASLAASQIAHMKAPPPCRTGPRQVRQQCSVRW
jgi:hypothetical protein